MDESTQVKILTHLRAEPKPMGSRKGRIVTKEIGYFLDYIDEDFFSVIPDDEYVAKYQDGNFNSYLKWAEDLRIIFEESAAKADPENKRTINRLQHAASLVQRAIDTAKSIY